MLDGLSLDQLRTFITASDTGSFSAAGRKLGRAQSVVSQSLANLEAQIGVTLFDRSGRYPVLTEIGRALLADARGAVGGVDQFKTRAKGLAGGLEPELSVVLDVLMPIAIVTDAVTAFHAQFPSVPLRLYVEALGAVVAPVLDGRCTLAVVASLPILPQELVREVLWSVQMVFVVSPKHPLAGHAGPITRDVLSEHIQLVLTDRSTLSKDREFAVFSARTWRLADLGAKHAFLRSGLGWGGMPLHLVEADLASGTLVRLAIIDEANTPLALPISAVYPAGSPPGPAGRWLVDFLRSKAAASPPRARAERDGLPSPASARRPGALAMIGLAGPHQRQGR